MKELSSIELNTLDLRNHFRDRFCLPSLLVELLHLQAEDGAQIGVHVVLVVDDLAPVEPLLVASLGVPRELDRVVEHVVDVGARPARGRLGLDLQPVDGTAVVQTPDAVPDFLEGAECGQAPDCDALSSPAPDLDEVRRRPPAGGPWWSSPALTKK